MGHSHLWVLEDKSLLQARSWHRWYSAQAGPWPNVPQGSGAQASYPEVLKSRLTGKMIMGRTGESGIPGVGSEPLMRAACVEEVRTTVWPQFSYLYQVKSHEWTSQGPCLYQCPGSSSSSSPGCGVDTAGTEKPIKFLLGCLRILKAHILSNHKAGPEMGQGDR